MNRIIQYAIHKDDGLVISRVGNEVAWPVLQFQEFGKDGNFTGPLPYALESSPVLDIGREWQRLKWTKKIPVDLKNKHRAFWGFKPLPSTKRYYVVIRGRRRYFDSIEAGRVYCNAYGAQHGVVIGLFQEE
jgi:hypothetical protein